MKRIVLISGFLIIWTTTVKAQASDSWIDSVLIQVQKNNPQLKALHKSNQAEIAELKAGNTIGETAVEYSPFYQRGVSGLASSELIVSQEFDFPTLYNARRKSTVIQQDIKNREYDILCRDILLETAKICYDLEYAIENRQLINQRMAASDTLLSIYEKRMLHGDATIIDLNRVKMDRMNLMTEKVKNEGETRSIMAELERLGCKDVTPGINPTKPKLTALTNRDINNALAEKSTELSYQELKITQQGWLPKLTVGYRRNTEVRESLNGFLVGVSMPLFSNQQKVKAARQRIDAMKEQEVAIRHEMETKRHALEVEVNNLRNIISTYDNALMQQTLTTLLRAVNCGEMSVIEYYNEADRIYSIIQEHIETKNKYNKAVLELECF